MGFKLHFMRAALTAIGDELLIGQVTDTNSTWIAEQLNLIGVEVKEIRSISDNASVIHETLAYFESRVELVVLTGGLGPTKDDITKAALTDYFGGSLKESPEVLSNIEHLFRLRGMKLSELNRLQAKVPDNCIILNNLEGTAPGMVFERNNTIFVSLPGVPYEMKHIVSRELIPFLANRMNGSIIVHRTVMTQGIPESYLASRIEEWETNLPENCKLAYLPRPGIVRLRLTAIGDNRKLLELSLQNEIDKLLHLKKVDIFATEDINLENVLGQILLDKKATVSVAESCTGGNIAHLITSVAGSSQYFKGGIVAYSNELKIKELGIEAAIISSYGAVSREVVEKMALSARHKFLTDFAIATSGIAGPGGGSEDKPVGLTWIAVASSEKCLSNSFLFGEHRGRNIEKASYSALNLLRKMVLGID